MSELTFDHVNLTEIDPNQAEIAEGMYTFQVSKVEKKTYNVKDKTTGQPTGEVGERLVMQLSVVNDEKYSGRRFFPAFFNNNGSLRQLRKIMDATGVAQTGTVEEWGTEVTGSQFKAPIKDNPKRIDPQTGKPERQPNLWETQPVG